MRLLYVFPEPLPLPRARGVQVVNAVASLAAEVEEIVLAFVPAGHADPFPAYGLGRPDNVRLLPLSRGLPWPLSGLSTHSNRLFVARLAAWLGRERRRNPPDMALVRHVKLGAGLLDRCPWLPLAYEAHEVFADTASERQRPRMAALERHLVAGAALVLANSRATADRLRVRYRLDRDIHPLPNGVTVPPVPAAKAWDELKRRVIYTGSLFGWKGVEDLVAAAARLPGWRITLIGGSADQVERLRAAAPKEGAELVFRGHLPHSEVAAALADACIAVLPNRADPDSAFTSPLKLFEYLAAGCAVVATDLPAVREVLGDEDAAWARPNDPASLAAAIAGLGDDPGRAKALAERGWQTVQAYSWPLRAAKLGRLLEHALRP